MDIKTLCLGLLCDGDASGYDLKKQFESTFKHFYPAGYGSIYPSLAVLADQGLVQCHAMPQDKKPDRKVYRITEAGRQAFRISLADASPEHKLRSEYLVAMYFADYLEPERLEQMLTSWNQSLSDGVARLELLEQKFGTDVPPGTRFVLGFGKALATAMARYVEENRSLLLPASGPHPATSTRNKRVDARIESNSTAQTTNSENRV